jgi:hypothetical protein
VSARRGLPRLGGVFRSRERAGAFANVFTHDKLQ